DLDGFKNVNDTRGHAHGDHVLAAVAHRLENTRRLGDVVARVGGDEFALLLDDLDHQFDTDAIIERVQGAFEEPFHVDGTTWRLSLAIGVATSEPGVTAESLLTDADNVMYHSKSAPTERNPHSRRPGTDPTTDKAALEPTVSDDDLATASINAVNAGVQELLAVGTTLTSCAIMVEGPLGERLATAIGDLDRVITDLRYAAFELVPRAVQVPLTRAGGQLPASDLPTIMTDLDRLAAHTDRLAESAVADLADSAQLLDASHSIHRAIVSLKTHPQPIGPAQF
ncbi:MAG TPA: GGDEF domain-containing protein, partial [Acidimicrobiales bacterium]|nr:GGDEF domain-containing protein [Acidimicrobiales bacterium]